jgi:thiamine-monophosphate kinase
MAAEPRCFLLSLALPQACTGKWMDAFLGGLRRASRKLKCPLAGGDTTRRNEILINLCVVGEVKQGRAVRRTGAAQGNRIFVSGGLGEAELGLRLWERKKQGASRRAGGLSRKHLYPEPRIALGRWLGENQIATAMMDLSDGLSLDLARLCKASGVGARIYSNKLPLAPEIFRGEFAATERMSAALNGGDDYELLFCVASRVAAKVPRTFSGIELTEIGEITDQPGIKLIQSSGEAVPLEAGGWDPFRN